MTGKEAIKTCKAEEQLTPEQSEEVRRAFRVGMLTNDILDFVEYADEPDAVTLDALVSALVVWYMESHYTGEVSDIEFLKSLVDQEVCAMASEMDLDYLEDNMCRRQGCCCGKKPDNPEDRPADDGGITECQACTDTLKKVFIEDPDDGTEDFDSDDGFDEDYEDGDIDEDGFFYPEIRISIRGKVI